MFWKRLTVINWRLATPGKNPKIRVSRKHSSKVKKSTIRASLPPVCSFACLLWRLSAYRPTNQFKLVCVGRSNSKFLRQLEDLLRSMWRKRTYEARPVSITLSLCHSANWTLGHCVSVTLSHGQLVTRSLCFKHSVSVFGPLCKCVNNCPISRE